MGLAEPDVAITDFLIAVECAAFVVLLGRRARHPLRGWFLGIFLSIGCASLLGGIVHGFFPEETTLGYRLLWPATLVALAAMASFIGVAGAHLLVRPPYRSWIHWFAAAAFLVVSGFIVVVDGSFWVVVITYLPSIVWLAAGYVSEMRRRRSGGAILVGFVGLMLTLAAAGIQQGGISPHPRYFNHNALYHVVQAVALLLIFSSTLALMAPVVEEAGESCSG